MKMIAAVRVLVMKIEVIGIDHLEAWLSITGADVFVVVLPLAHRARLEEAMKTQEKLTLTISGR